MKRIFAFVLVFVLIFSSVSVFADKTLKTEVGKITVLGDSVSTGYGLEGYPRGEDDESLGSYVDLLTEYYDLSYGESIFNFAEDGETSESLAKRLGEGLTEDEKTTISKSGVVIITVGGNDIVNTLTPMISGLLGIEGTSDAKAVLTALLSVKDNKIEGFVKESEKLCENNEKALTSLYSEFGKNLSSSIAEIKKLSPDAKIFVQNIYDPTYDLPAYKTVSALRTNVVSKVLSNVNKRIERSAKDSGAYFVDVASEFLGRKSPCTNISEADVHPNLYGHLLIMDALAAKIDAVFDGKEDKNEGSPNSDAEPDWLWLVVAVVLISIALPVIVTVMRKISENEKSEKKKE